MNDSFELRYQHITDPQRIIGDPDREIAFGYVAPQGELKQTALVFDDAAGYEDAFRSLTTALAVKRPIACIADVWFESADPPHGSGKSHVKSARFEHMKLNEQLANPAVGMRFSNVRNCAFAADTDNCEFQGYIISFRCDGHDAELTLAIHGFDSALNDLLLSWRDVGEHGDLAAVKSADYDFDMETPVVRLKFVLSGAEAD